MRTALARVVRGAVAGLLLGAGLHAGMILAGNNFHAVLPGEVYRCAQPSGAQLERFIRRHGIRTVVNLRGCCPGAGWYADEARVAAGQNVSLEDINFSATRLPSPQSLRELVEVIDGADYPLLFHCHQGADRTGLASVLAVLLRTEATLDQALLHLGPATGHLPIGKTRHVDEFFAFYGDWLAATGRPHSPGTLRGWIRDHYCPGEGRARITLAAAGPGRVHVPAHTARVVTVRCRNTSTRAWHFRPGNNAGIHLSCFLADEGKRWMMAERAGLLFATVEPGGSIDLKAPVPALAPGRYEMLVDLIDEQHGAFTALGSEPLLLEVVAR